MKKFVALLALAGALSFVYLVPASAQASRTWVSGVGSDANPCSRTAPCQTFAGAISKTAVNGQISVLDSSGFGALTITKSISIVAEGAEGSALACATNSFIVNAGASDVVNIRGISFQGCATGIYGIKVLSAKSVFISRCAVHGFLNANGGGIGVVPTSATVNVTVSDCSLTRNKHGVFIEPTGGGQATVVLDHVVIDGNTSMGIRVDGAAGQALVSNSVITGQGNRGLYTSGGGTIVSFGNNVLRNNATDGTFSSTVPLQ
jgi:hypothetical protein